MDATYDGTLGTAGGAAFGTALTALAEAAHLDAAALAEKAGLPLAIVTGTLAGTERVGIAVLARLARALRLKAVEFMQQSGLLSLDVYALGLDPLYFLPEGPVRFDARIYMREINPRHTVPEGDMLKRNPLLAAVTADALLDPIGKIELELTYLLRTAIQVTGGSL